VPSTASRYSTHVSSSGTHRLTLEQARLPLLVVAPEHRSVRRGPDRRSNCGPALKMVFLASSPFRDGTMDGGEAGICRW
jgi:hypothetical protein